MMGGAGPNLVLPGVDRIGDRAAEQACAPGHGSCHLCVLCVCVCCM